MRLDSEETLRTIDATYIEESERIHRNILELVGAGEDPKTYRADPDSESCKILTCTATCELARISPDPLRMIAW